MADSPLPAVGNPDRLAALDNTGLLDTAPEASFNRFTQLALDLLDVRASLISLVGPDRQFIKSSAGLEKLGVTDQHQHLSLPRSFAELVVNSGEPVIVDDARADDRLEETIDVDELGILAYAAFPLRITANNHVVGAFCALNDAPYDWTEREIGILEALSKAVVAHIELQEAKIEAEGAEQKAEDARQEAEEARQEAEEARQEAEDASAAKSRFVANMSHELRTPLNSVIGYSEMFMEDPTEWDAERLKDGLQRIHSSGQQLLSLINDVLNLSKAEAGRLGVSLAPFSLSTVVDEIGDELQPTMEGNGNTFETGLSSIPDELCSDESKVRQIMSNLLSNAAKYTEDGTVTLRAHLENANAPDLSDEWKELQEQSCGAEATQRELVLTVSDDGIGMAPEEQEKIFEAFERSEEAEKTGGTGLGLGIVQNLCQLLNGDVTVESEKGAGSTFTARILVSVPPEASAGMDELPQRVAEHLAGHLPPQKEDLVLVIDDDRDARILLRNHLVQSGFRVETASNGLEGLEQANELHPMAITLDVLMEGMDGWEVLSHLKEADHLRHIPVVVISITPDEGRGFQLGATDHLVKPVDRERLTELLTQYQAASEGQRFSVLVVEDDQATRDVARQVIAEEAGHEVYEAANGQEALDLLDEGVSPSLVLLDLMMPEINGFEFLEATRAHLKEVPVVVLTAKDLTDEDVARLNGQVEQIIRKEGRSREDLLNEVRSHIERLQQVQASTAEP